MRIRKKPYAKEELEASNFYVKNAEKNKGKWKQAFLKEQPIYLELGCGKGIFCSKISAQNTSINFLAIDLISEMLLIAKRNVEMEFKKINVAPNNILIMAYDIEQILNIMDENDKIERIYINFCNPWPKSGHKKRRLTHTRQLEKYLKFLVNDGEIHMKTDDDDLFTESINYFEECRFEIIYQTYDLHSEDDIQDNIITEHEKVFIEKGVKIKKLIAKKTMLT